MVSEYWYVYEKSWKRRELHPQPWFRNYLPSMWLRHGDRSPAGNGPGGCGTPRVGRKLAQPDIFRQGQDRRSVAVRVRVGSVIDRGAPRDSPFPIFLARARSDCHPRSEAKNHDRACVPRWSWSTTLIARLFPSGGYLHDRKQKTKADLARTKLGKGELYHDVKPFIETLWGRSRNSDHFRSFRLSHHWSAVSRTDCCAQAGAARHAVKNAEARRSRNRTWQSSGRTGRPGVRAC